MRVQNTVQSDRLWAFSSLVGIAILYLSLVGKTTGDFDRLTTDALFWSAILWLLWQKRDREIPKNDPLASFGGFLLLGLVLFKVLHLYDFEFTLLPLIPFASAIALSLIVSGFQGFTQYSRELFFAWFLFFPTGVIGNFLDKILHITTLNAKFATYLLYYLGFNTASHNNEVILWLPEVGKFKAIVDYPCAGVPMILLIFKLALLLIAGVSFSKKLRLLIPMFSLVLGFMLGVVRVCILTLSIPNRPRFYYWHGSQGSQIFSTLAIIIFSGVCYWIMCQQEQKSCRSAIESQ